MSTRLAGDDKSLSARFAGLQTFNDVAGILDVEPRKLGYYLRKPQNYKVFKIHKRAGGERVISSPTTPLKIIQRKLNQVLQAVYVGRSPVHGFACGKSIVTNANRHLDRSQVLNLDLEDFFPSIHFGRVKGLFEGKPYRLPPTVAVTLAQICCHDGVLPAGAPTSPVVANMICARMDSALKHLAVDCGCTYTRYADDITFSVRYRRFPPAIAYRDPGSTRWTLGGDLLRIISENGFRINESKTRLMARGRRQEVTGLVVGKRINVRRDFVRQTRAMLHAAEKWGLDAASHEFHRKYDRRQRSKTPDFRRVLRGKIEFLGSVRGRDDLIYARLLQRYLKLDPEAHARPIVVGQNAPLAVAEWTIWLLEDEETGIQGTGFATAAHGLLTAAHVLAPHTQAQCPSAGLPMRPLKVLAKHEHVDVARLSLDVRPPAVLRVGDPRPLAPGTEVRVLGFPLHRAGATVNIQRGVITAFHPWHGVPHLVVDCPIIRGNSGGPVLNIRNEVVGIAVHGQREPGRFGDDDAMSQFVPIDFALQHLR